ncbi:MAG: response regulator [Bacteroidetes bacterium]|nr:response regulator [Bacteroidota bacterium]
MINTIIVENEKEPIKLLTDLLSIHFPEIKIQAICENLPDAVEQIRKLNPELLFLDVELQSKTTGFDVLQQTTGLNYRVIFTTSHSKYAEKAFRYSALDFLKKPFGIKELTEVIEKFKYDLEFDKENVRLKSLIKNLKQEEINNLEIMFSIHNGYQRLTVGDIIFCMSENGGTRFFLKGNERFFTSKSLGSIEEKLKDCRFSFT